MIKKILQIIFLLFALFSFVMGRNYNYTNDWQIKGFGGYTSDINPSNLLYNNPHIKYIWAFQDGEWRLGAITEFSQNSGYPAISSIKNNEGFWVKADANGTMQINIADDTSFNKDLLSIKSGWHMYGVDRDINSSVFNDTNIKITQLAS